MAIDFPSNPTNGQVYGNWIYDSSITSWRNVNTDSGIGTLNAMGLKNVVPTSVNVASGSATFNSNGTVSFSGVSALQLNGVFSSTYENYKVVLNVSSTSTATDFALQLAQSGTYWTANYQYAKGSMLNSTWASDVQTTAALMNVARSSGSGGSAFSADILSPQKTQASKVLGQYVQGSSIWFGNSWGNQTDSVSFDGIRIALLTGGATMTGTFQVFGYTN